MRKQRKIRSNKAMKMDTINKIMEDGCSCKSRKCIQQFTPVEIREKRSHFWCLSETRRREFLLNAFALDTWREDEKRQYQFSINGKPVCHVGWYKVMGISRSW